MNFKLIFLFCTIFIFSSCGVKAPPTPEESSVIPSYLNLNKTKLTPADREEDSE